MKKITAYDVGGTIYKNKKEAEKAEVKHKEALARKQLEGEKAKLLAKVDEINVKLGCNTFKNAAQPVPKPKFKNGDKVRALESCVCVDHRGCIGKIARVDSIVSPFTGRSYAVQFGSVPRLRRFGTKTSVCVIPEKDLELVGAEKGKARNK